MTQPKTQLLIGCGRDWTKKLRLASDPNPNWEWLTTVDNNPDHSPDIVHDLTQLPLPACDESFDEIHAYEVLEHTGQQGDYMFFFAQFTDFYRLLKPDGHIFATVPSRHSQWAWGDPSHTRIIQPESLIFLQQPMYTNAVGKTPMSDFRHIYKADFDVVHCDDNGDMFSFVLKAVKPSRIEGGK